MIKNSLKTKQWFNFIYQYMLSFFRQNDVPDAVNFVDQHCLQAAIMMALDLELREPLDQSDTKMITCHFNTMSKQNLMK